jgi:hypothetical protein
MGKWLFRLVPIALPFVLKKMRNRNQGSSS